MEAIINAKAVLPDRVLPDATILVENGRIHAVGQGIPVPENARVMDAGGMLVGPGFVDIHVHGDGYAARWRNEPEQVARHHLRHGSHPSVNTSHPSTKVPHIRFIAPVGWSVSFLQGANA